MEELKTPKFQGKSLALNDLLTQIDCIDEVAIIAAGYETNHLIEVLGKIIDNEKDKYYTDFDKLVNLYYGIPGGGYAGFDLNDLAFFKRQNPHDPQVADAFRTYVNTKWGTNIPLDEEMKKDADNRLNANNTKLENAAITVEHMKFLERSGGLSNGVTYNLLSRNKNYQEALELTSKQL